MPENLDTNQHEIVPFSVQNVIHDISLDAINNHSVIGSSSVFADQNGVLEETRKERKQGERCNSETCKNSSKRKCNEIREEARKEMFTAFWKNLSWDQRKVYVCNLVSRQETSRKTKDENSRRSCSLYYSLNVGDKLIPVCKKMFLGTLGLGEWSVKSWVETSHYGTPSSGAETNSRRLPRKSQNDSFITTFLEKLPKLPSHYCRKDTTKLYLEHEFSSYSDLYKAFVDYSKTQNTAPASRNTLIKWVHKKNIGIFKPRKDRCDTCVQYESQNLSLEDWEQHRTDKERAQKEKNDDKEKAMQVVCHVITVDLQAVKKYLQNAAHIKPIIIYSDGCTYQNRNSTMANALLSLSRQYNVQITQKFLIKGHFQMECDSVHAVIERKLKNKNIEIPNDYYRLTGEARQNPFPYEVVTPDFTFFKNYSADLVYYSIRPGKKSNDPTVTQIRALQYEQGLITYKINFDQEFAELPHRPRRTPNDINQFLQLFEHKLPIAKKEIRSFTRNKNQNWSKLLAIL
ncbi:unnamed protein product [Acanthoscelides obtectus]|uniref:Uncharacterized protein n=1 Tax=Acanthoscelides obtectus TaxID=200917 RepID=A0A9P0JIE4_ACAOB|nr:unnamed protein product [Acanthoscelides obtectus]CAK1649926.1 hypothetical protein AOBTE_LOCUS16495 [Acanthoscelides obtectus]